MALEKYVSFASHHSANNLWWGDIWSRKEIWIELSEAACKLCTCELSLVVHKKQHAPVWLSVLFSYASLH